MNATLYANDNGRISCAAHGGAYLKGSVAASPRSRTHRTPLGTWERMTAFEVAEVEAIVPGAGRCEECGAR